MPNVIHQLPDSVANQIAAGEVIQRPASVVKELTENSIDAGAKNIRVTVKDAGRTLVMVEDDGCGMSPIDARLAFERHATSKISQVTDLYALQTMGFRGEALASIAAVAQVELITRRAEDEAGLKLEIAASRVTGENLIATDVGSKFLVKNLFFNVPARRRFLKSDSAELRHISTEFLRVALAHPDVTLSLTSNGAPIFMFPQGNVKQRVASVAGKAMSQELLPIEAETQIVTVHGFVGTPQTAKKSGGDQYFFVNDRFMRHPYLHKAVMEAYKNIIPTELTPAYFIYLTVDPKCIDVNVHPQKTEIKFDEESSVWQILNAAVRECLGKFNIMPSIDFDTANSINIPPLVQGQTVDSQNFAQTMQNPGDMTYNPFEHERDDWQNIARSNGFQPHRQSVAGWENLYQSNINQQFAKQGVTTTIPSKIGAEPLQNEIFPSQLDASVENSGDRFFQLRGRYIVTPVRSGLMFIDQRRAHERILYERLSAMINENRCQSEHLMFPEIVAIGAEDACIIEEIGDELHRAGMDVEYDADKGQLIIKSIPSMMVSAEIQAFIESIVYDFRNGEVDIQSGVMDYVTQILSMKGAIPYGKLLSVSEMTTIFDDLFACQSPSLTPRGKTVFAIVPMNTIESLF